MNDFNNNFKKGFLIQILILIKKLKWFNLKVIAFKRFFK